MCFSCNSVYNELVDKLKEIGCNLNINVVSGKRNDLWMYRKYTDTELDKKMEIKRSKRKKGGKK